jgi:uncharacterized protein (TIGR03085 family)
MVSFAQAERARLADLLTQVGPHARTLCAGWQARDLAAHVVLRERRPDAAVGILVRPLAGHTRSVQDHLAGTPWPELVATVRSRSPLLVGPLDDLINSTEFFVHAEDVRRAQPGWEPLGDDPRRDGVLWRVLRSRGRLFFRRAPVGVVLALPDGRTCTANARTPAVTLTGAPAELLLYAYGRTEQARVQLSGDDDTLAEFSDTPLDV